MMRSTPSRSLLWLSLFAIAMAHVEASLVVHLRSLYYPDNPLALFPLALLSHRDLAIELVRELATVIMLLSVAMLAARHPARVFVAFVYLFGLWDLFYYLWLQLMIGWPVSWLEWDVLFLIPWPWFGPWIAAAAIALLFTLWGAWAWLARPGICFDRRSLLLFCLGAVLALAAFLQPAWSLLSGGEAAFRGYVPHDFAWSLYLPGLLLMAVGLWQAGRQRQPSPDKRGRSS